MSRLHSSLQVMVYAVQFLETSVQPRDSIDVWRSYGNAENFQVQTKAILRLTFHLT